MTNYVFRFFENSLFQKLSFSLTFLLYCAFLSAQNNALNFDGQNDYVEANSPITGNTDFTLELWLTDDNTSTTSYRDFLAWDVFNGTERLSFGGSSGELLIVDDAFNGGSAFIQPFVGTNLRDGQPHYFAYTKSGNQVTVYLDNQTFSYTTNAHQPMNLVSTFRMGGRVATTQQHWNGTLDEFRIWNHARTAAELTTNNSCELIGTELGLVLYYNFNQGVAGGTNSETQVDDNSNNGFNGSLNNISQNGATSNWVATPTSISNICFLQKEVEIVKQAVDAQNNGAISGIKNGEEFFYQIDFSVNTDLSDGLEIIDNLPDQVELVGTTANIAMPPLSNSYCGFVASTWTTVQYDANNHQLIFQTDPNQGICIGTKGTIVFKVRYKGGFAPCTNDDNCNYVTITGYDGSNIPPTDDYTQCLVVDYGPSSYASLSTPCSPEVGKKNMYTFRLQGVTPANLHLYNPVLKVDIQPQGTITQAFYRIGGGGGSVSIPFTGSNPFQIPALSSDNPMLVSNQTLDRQFYFLVDWGGLPVATLVSINYTFCYEDNCGNQHTLTGSISHDMQPASGNPPQTFDLFSSPGVQNRGECCTDGINFSFYTDEFISQGEVVVPIPASVKPFMAAVSAGSADWHIEADDAFNNTCYVAGGTDGTCVLGSSPCSHQYCGSYFWAIDFPTITPQSVCNDPSLITQLSEVRVPFTNLQPCETFAGSISFHYNPTTVPGGNPLPVTINFTGTVTYTASQSFTIQDNETVTTGNNDPFYLRGPGPGQLPHKFLVEQPASNNSQAHPNPYNPGECALFRLAIDNFGYDNLNGLKITDYLHPDASMLKSIWVKRAVGGFSNQFPNADSAPDSWMMLSGPTGGPWTTIHNDFGTVTATQTGNTLDIDIDNFPGICTGSRIYIDYTVLIDNNATVNSSLCNNFEISSTDTDFTDDFPSGVFPPVFNGEPAMEDCVEVVPPAVQLDIQKDFVTTGTITPGQLVQYDININNPTNTDVTNIVLVDNMPYPSDVKPLTGTPRGSTGYLEYPIPYNTHPGSTPEYRDILLTSNNYDPGNFVDLCVVSPNWTGFTNAGNNNANSVKLQLGPNCPLNGGSSLTVPWYAVVPVGTPDGTQICNDIVYQATMVSNSTLLIPAQSNETCFTINDCNGCTVGGFVWFDQNEDGLQDGNEPGYNGLIVHLRDNTGIIATTISADNFAQDPGYYEFCVDMPAGFYQIEVQQQQLPGYNLTSTSPNLDPNLNSDVDPFSFVSAPFSFQAPCPTPLDLDIGVIQGDPCACTSYSGWNVDNLTTNSSSNPSCGGTVTGTCDDNFQVFLTQNCQGTNCQAQYDWVFLDPNGTPVLSGSSSLPALNLTLNLNGLGLTPGTYTLEVTSDCGTIGCSTCTLDFDLSCSNCSCQRGFLQFTDANGNITNANCGQSITLNECDNSFDIQAIDFCTSGCTFSSPYSWQLQGGSVNIGGLSLGGPFNFSPGNYTFTVYPNCGGQNCRFCVVNINVLPCPPPPCNALQFDGIDDMVQLPTNPIAGNVQNFTIEGWFFPQDTDGPNDFERIIGISGSRLEVGISGGNFAFYTNTAGSITTLAPIQNNIWYHFALVRSGANLTFYLNGQAFGPFNYTNVNLGNFRIGRWGGNGGLTESWQGMIDEVRIWSTSRTLAQITNNMNCQVNPADPALLAYFDFNQGNAGQANATVNQLIDRTGNGFTAPLSNFALTGNTSNWVNANNNLCIPCACVANNPTACQVLGNNLVNNGDFEGGDTNFSSSLGNSNTPNINCICSNGGCCIMGTYCVTTNARNKCTVAAWQSILAPEGFGNYMVVDGQNGIIWQQQVTVNANTAYTFAFDLYTNISGGAGTQLEMWMNNQPIMTNISGTANSWTTVSTNWTSGNAGTFLLEIRQNNGVGNNDYGIDNVCFFSTASNMSVQNYSETICKHETTVLNPVITGGSGTINCNWSLTPGLSSSIDCNPTFTPPNPGVYQFNVTATDANSCTANGTVTIVVDGDCCCVSDTEFDNWVNQGFSANINCNMVTLTPNFNFDPACDEITWRWDDVNNSISSSVGSQSVSFTYPNSGTTHVIGMKVVRKDANGNVCKVAYYYQTINLPNCNCTCPIHNETADGFYMYSGGNCHTKIFTPKSLHPSCNDVIYWEILDNNFTPIQGANSLSYSFTYTFPVNGVYYIDMIAERYPAGGGQCKGHKRQQLQLFCTNPSGGSGGSGNRVVNAGFTEGATGGVLGSDGAISNWETAIGEPTVGVDAGCGDDNYVTLFGNQDNVDAIQQQIEVEPETYHLISFCYRVRAAEFGDLPPGTAIVFRASTTPQTGAACEGECEVWGRYPIGAVEGDVWQQISQDPIVTNTTISGSIYLTVHIENGVPDEGLGHFLSHVDIDNIVVETDDLCNAVDLHLALSEEFQDYPMQGPGYYKAFQILTSDAIIGSAADFQLQAGNEITFLPNFEVQLGGELYAYIDDCNSSELPLSEDESEDRSWAEEDTENDIEENTFKPQIRCFPNPAQSSTTIEWSISEKQQGLSLQLLDLNGQQVKLLGNTNQLMAGQHQMTVSTETLAAGIYTIVLHTKEGVITERLVILK